MRQGSIKLFLCITIIISACGFTGNSNKTKAHILIDNYINKIGGYKKIQSIQTYRSKGVWAVGDMKLNYETMVSFPDKLKIITETTDYKEISTYVSGTGKSKTNDSLFTITNPRVLKSYEIDCNIIPIAHLKSNSKKIEYIKSLEAEGIKLDEVFIEFKNGLTYNVFFNSETQLIHSIKSSEDVEIKHLKYQLINDILFPVEFQFTTSQNNDLKLQLREIEYNIKLDESEFQL